MKISQISMALPLCLAFITTPAFADFKWIKSEKEYRAKVVDRPIRDQYGNTYVIKPDGTFTGKTTKGTKVVGAWNWQGRYWCRNLVVGKKKAPTDCIKIELDGKKYRATRNKGKGDSIEGTILK